MAASVKNLDTASPKTQPISSGDSASLDKKVEKLMEALRQKGCMLEEHNKKTVLELIDHKDELSAQYERCALQRDKNLERAFELNQSLESANDTNEKLRTAVAEHLKSNKEADAQMNKHIRDLTVYGTAGVGFGWTLAYLFSRSPEEKFLSALGGMILGVFTAEQKNKKPINEHRSTFINSKLYAELLLSSREKS